MIRGHRVWDNQEKSYDFDREFVLSSSGELMELCSRHNGTWEYHFADTDRFIVEFDTGLEDKNGNEIYEGDFLRRVRGGHKHFEHLATYLVSFDEEMAKFRFVKVGYDGELAPSHVRKCYEIVGNIHENGGKDET